MFWTVERANFGLEAYSAVYGLSPDNLNMESEIVLGVDPSSENVTYTVILDNLQPLTVYYYSVRAENLAGVTYSSVEIFATRKISCHGDCVNY